MSYFAPPAPALQQQRVLWRATGLNMNITTDQALTKVGVFSSFIIDKIVITNASTSLSLAAGGIYTATSKGGDAIVAAAQVYAALTGATVVLNATIGAPGLLLLNASALYLALTVAQGGAATADLYIIGTALS